METMSPQPRAAPPVEHVARRAGGSSPGFPRQRRIRKRREFSSVFDSGQRIHGRFFTLGTSIGIGDYDKLVGLLEEAFDGTEQPGSKLPIAYTEYGVQTRIPESAQGPYTNLQSPIGRDAVDEGTQARYYREALELAACQPTVIAIFFFHLIDEPDLNRWQSGPYYVDLRPKTSLPAIREAAEKARKGELAACS